MAFARIVVIIIGDSLFLAFEVEFENLRSMKLLCKG